MSTGSNQINTNISPLKQFAFLGGPEGFPTRLSRLVLLAEPENWYFDNPTATKEDHRKHGLLFHYIHHTFARAKDEGKILTDDDNALMNTGLFTPNGEEIYMLFDRNTRYNENSDVQKWHLDSFYKESSLKIPDRMRGSLPEYVNYFSGNPQDMYFDTSRRITINIDHILDDNFERLPEAIRTYPIEVIRTLFVSAETILRKRISRNNRLVIPQYYNKKIAYLAPLTIGKDIIPLAIEKNEDTYRVNTIFTKEMAYCNARLLAKPESNWLIY
jgi:hypothetical protein